MARSRGREIITAQLVPRFLRIPLSGLAFLLFYSGAAVIAWVLLPIHRHRHRHLPPGERRAALDHFMMRCYRAALEMMGGMKLLSFSLPDFESANLPPPPWVLVANHPSLIDVLFIKGTLPGVTVLVKSALFRAPSLRRLFDASGDFKGPEKGDATFGETSVLDTFVERLEAGQSVLVFPEGTRSPSWRLRRFRRGAAEAAVRAGAPIVPIFVLVDPPVLKKGDKWYDMPQRTPRFEIELFPAIDTVGRDSRQLTAEIRDLLAERLETARVAATQRGRE